MQKADAILIEIDCLLDRLIESANELLSHSRQRVDEEELIRLQKVQEELLTALINKDEEFHRLPKSVQKKHMSKRGEIERKIDEFQRLNAHFLDNLSAARGLIQFNTDSHRLNS